MAPTCAPPLSVGRASDSTFSEPLKDWTVARTPLDSRFWNSCCTSSGSSAGKCSLPRKQKRENYKRYTCAGDLKGEPQQAHGDGQDTGEGHLLSVAVVGVDDAQLTLTDLQDNRPIQTVTLVSDRKDARRELLASHQSLEQQQGLTAPLWPQKLHT
ncbi:hypothetical protein EYF80_022007 [Liparis tanakae]|uniref:Uncharacterized protein n=1 Tax=Liparis tanakae TaxID=230148 RepID=A0A4Z2HQ45_9TELE|nr:hypothetical protein EYF80_022007 [Liparis tanakae]